MTEELITSDMIEEAFDSVLDSNDPGVEKLAKLAFDLQEKNEKLYRALDVYQRERDRFKHAHPEMSGAYFLSGGHGEKDDNMLPEFVTIVPAYGCAWEQVYQKVDRTINYEGS